MLLTGKIGFEDMGVTGLFPVDPSARHRTHIVRKRFARLMVPQGTHISKNVPRKRIKNTQALVLMTATMVAVVMIVEWSHRHRLRIMNILPPSVTAIDNNLRLKIHTNYVTPAFPVHWWWSEVFLNYNLNLKPISLNTQLERSNLRNGNQIWVRELIDFWASSARWGWWFSCSCIWIF